MNANRDDSKAPVLLDVFDRIFAETTPYVPQNTDYALELGTMFADHNLYWTGATIGFNFGPCIGLGAPKCQQYFSISAGIGGREGHTHAMSFGAIRWQYIAIPKTYSPFLTVFGGVMNSIVPGEVTQSPVAGGSLGMYFYLHESADLKIEGRLGGGNRPFFQLLAAAQIKMDHWVEYFVLKVRDLGIDTAKTAKEAVVTTVTRPGDAMGTVLEVSADAIKKTGEGIEGATKAIEGAVKTTSEELTSEGGEEQPKVSDDPTRSP